MNYNPLFDGPSRDHQALADAEQVWREEPHAIQPASVPVTLQTQNARPVTTLPVRDLVGARIGVMVKDSNRDPAAEGKGKEFGHQSWLNRSPYGKSFLGDESPTAGLQKTIMISALIGLGAWVLFFRK